MRRWPDLDYFRCVRQFKLLLHPRSLIGHTGSKPKGVNKMDSSFASTGCPKSKHLWHDCLDHHGVGLIPSFSSRYYGGKCESIYHDFPPKLPSMYCIQYSTTKRTQRKRLGEPWRRQHLVRKNKIHVHYLYDETMKKPTGKRVQPSLSFSAFFMDEQRTVVSISIYPSADTAGGQYNQKRRYSTSTVVEMYWQTARYFLPMLRQARERIVIAMLYRRLWVKKCDSFRLRNEAKKNHRRRLSTVALVVSTTGEAWRASAFHLRSSVFL